MAPRDINIITVSNGYVCKVGCSTLCFETREKLIEELRQYLADPEAVEKRFAEAAKENGFKTFSPYIEPSYPVALPDMVQPELRGDTYPVARNVGAPVPVP